MTAVSKISALVTFLPTEEGGRAHPAHDSSNYMPHVVVGDPSQRVALVDESGTSTESYLGVRFTGDGQQLTPGLEHEVQLQLLYVGRVDYSALVPAATFTIREGGRVVGFGSVVGWLPN